MNTKEQNINLLDKRILNKVLNVFLKFSQNNQVSENLKNQIEKKRPLVKNPSSYYIEINQKLINEVLEAGALTRYELKKIGFIYKDGIIHKNLKDRFLLLSKGIDNQFIYYTSKKFVKSKDESKSLKPKGYSSIPFNLQDLNSSIDKLIICESEEKALACKDVLNNSSIACIGLTGIHDKIETLFKVISEELKEHIRNNVEIILIFDDRLDEKKKETIELKALYNQLKNLNQMDIHKIKLAGISSVFEGGIDDYLEKIEEDNRKEELEKILSEAIYKSDFEHHFRKKETFFELIKDLKRIKTKIEYQDISTNHITTRKIKEDIDRIVSLRKNDLLYHLKQDNNFDLIDVSEVGTGKTSTIYKLIESGKRILFVTLNKETRREFIEKSNLNNELFELISNSDLMLEHTKDLDIDKKTIIENKVIKLIESGLTKEAKKYIESELEIIIPEFTQDIPKDKSLVCTYEKFFNDDRLIHSSGTFDLIVFDENIITQVLKKVDISLDKLKNDSIFYENTEVKRFIELLSNFVKNKREIKGNLFKNTLNNDCKKNDFDLNKFLNDFTKENAIKYDTKQLNIILKDKDFDETKLPDIKGLRKFLSILKDSPKDVYIDKDENLSVRSISAKYKIEARYIRSIKRIKNTKILNLDSTANIKLLNDLGLNINESSIINYGINREVEIIQDFRTSGTESTLLDIKTKELKPKTKDRILGHLELSSNYKKSLIISTKNVSDKLENDDLKHQLNFDTGYYGKHDKGLNSFSDIDTIIATTPKVSTEEIRRQATLIYGDSINLDNDYRKESTGYIDHKKNKELYSTYYAYKDENIQALYEQYIKVPIVQAIGRITRTDNKEELQNKKIIIMSNIPLSNFGLKISKVIDKDTNILREALKETLIETISILGFLPKGILNNLDLVLDSPEKDQTLNMIKFVDNVIYNKIISKLNTILLYKEFYKLSNSHNFRVEYIDKILKEIGIVEKNIPLPKKNTNKVIALNKEGLEQAEIILKGSTKNFDTSKIKDDILTKDNQLKMFNLNDYEKYQETNSIELIESELHFKDLLKKQALKTGKNLSIEYLDKFEKYVDSIPSNEPKKKFNKLYLYEILVNNFDSIHFEIQKELNQVQLNKISELEKQKRLIEIDNKKKKSKILAAPDIEQMMFRF